MTQTNPHSLNRRDLFKTSGCMAAGLLAGCSTTSATRLNPTVKVDPFKYCLNTSTIRGQNLPITEEIDIAARAGYTGIEPWLGKLNDYKKNGGSLKDLRNRINDHGLTVESAIGFARWIVDDDADNLRTSSSTLNLPPHPHLSAVLFQRRYRRTSFRSESCSRARCFCSSTTRSVSARRNHCSDGFGSFFSP